MVASEVAKEAIWLRKFLMEFGFIVKAIDPMTCIVIIVGLLLKPKSQRTKES